GFPVIGSNQTATFEKSSAFVLTRVIVALTISEVVAELSADAGIRSSISNIARASRRLARIALLALSTSETAVIFISFWKFADARSNSDLVEIRIPRSSANHSGISSGWPTRIALGTDAI